MDDYNRAVDLVCEAAHISQELFYETYGSEPLDKQAILNEFTNQSCFSPFKTVRGFTRDRALEMFKNVVNLALDQISKKEVLDRISTHDDLVIYFDNLLVDLANLHYGINCEEFKATLAKYEIVALEEVKPLVTQVLDTIASNSPNFK